MPRVLAGPTAPRPLAVEVVDRDMAKVLAAKSGAERLAIAAAMFRSARRMIESHLSTEHPEWDASRIQAEVGRRIGHGAG